MKTIFEKFLIYKSKNFKLSNHKDIDIVSVNVNSRSIDWFNLYRLLVCDYDSFSRFNIYDVNDNIYNILKCMLENSEYNNTLIVINNTKRVKDQTYYKVEKEAIDQIKGLGLMFNIGIMKIVDENYTKEEFLDLIKWTTGYNKPPKPMIRDSYSYRKYYRSEVKLIEDIILNKKNRYDRKWFEFNTVISILDKELKFPKVFTEMVLMGCIREHNEMSRFIDANMGSMSTSIYQDLYRIMIENFDLLYGRYLQIGKYYFQYIQDKKYRDKLKHDAFRYENAKSGESVYSIKENYDLKELSKLLWYAVGVNNRKSKLEKY